MSYAFKNHPLITLVPLCLGIILFVAPFLLGRNKKSEPVYYKASDIEPQNDNTFLGELGVAAVGAFANLIKVPGATTTVNFVISVVAGSVATHYAEEGELCFDN
ncbi:MAG: hypothetical protein KAJ29_05610 [Alphaproteobacteria bacterium]|nr:hypothetical protein [Alphaproteobacteria bacterium]